METQAKNIKIYIEQYEVPSNIIYEHKIAADLYLPYSGGHVVIQDMDGMLVNQVLLAVGRKITFVFEYEDTSKRYWVGRIIAIEAIENAQTSKDSLGNSYLISFIHYLYFMQPIETRGYYDKLSAIAQAEISKYRNELKNIEIEISDDTPTRYYQLQTRLVDFLFKNSVRTLIQSSPIITLIDDNNVYRFQGLSSLFSKNVIGSVAPPQSPVRITKSPAIPYSQAYLKVSPNNEIYALIKSTGQILNNENFSVSKVKSFLESFKGTYIADKNAIDLAKTTKILNYHYLSELENQAHFAHDVKNGIMGIQLVVHAEETFGVFHCGGMIEFVSRNNKAENDAAINNNFSGNYLIKRIEHIYQDSRRGTILYLVSPNLLGKTIESTQFGVLYNV